MHVRLLVRMKAIRLAYSNTKLNTALANLRLKLENPFEILELDRNAIRNDEWRLQRLPRHTFEEHAVAVEIGPLVRRLRL